MTDLLLTGGDVVTIDGVLAGGWLHVAGDRIGGLGPTGSAPPATATVVDCAGHIVVPGFVDIHEHGGGGFSYDGGPEAARTALATHRAHGTTTSVASLVSLPPATLRRALPELAELTEAGELAGVHLEGPWLSPARPGAHEPSRLHPPTEAELAELLSWGNGTIRMVTLAPELDGGLAAIEALTARGVVAAVGHTDATFGQARAAVAAGATVGTHLFNAMPPPLSRDPGPVLAMLDAPGVTIELIADGVHLHAAWVRHVLATVAPARVALVTDAMAAAGMPDGGYRLGGREVVVADGVARLAGGGAIAGGTATSDVLFRRAVVEYGLSLVDAASVTATTPAAALGLTDVGRLAAGLRADAVLLDGDLTVRRVLRAGRWVRR
ncbi:MAG: amidohydrolase family protein [Pseudonocardia sp.]|nr:amidohydrolase family protein [Pseudonocardia sp.]MBO0873249.1 amidohydrolase family protein [Pseudonocardia sp.]